MKTYLQSLVIILVSLYGGVAFASCANEIDIIAPHISTESGMLSLEQVQSAQLLLDEARQFCINGDEDQAQTKLKEVYALIGVQTSS